LPWAQTLPSAACQKMPASASHKAPPARRTRAAMDVMHTP
jgi:hypothetical protein